MALASRLESSQNSFMNPSMFLIAILGAAAFRVAMQGRPGPVVVSLPEDVLTETADVADAPRVEPAETSPNDGDMTLLGAHSLEGLNLKIDPVRKELVPAGPVITAAAA